MSYTQIVKLEKNYQLMHKDFNTLQKDIKELLEVLDKTIKLLEIPKRIHQELKELDTMLLVASKLLTALSLIPQITAPARAAKMTIDRVHVPVKRLVDGVGRIEAKIKPFRERFKQARKFLYKALSALESADAFVQTENKNLHAMKQSLKSTEKGRYQEFDNTALELFSQALNIILAIPVQILHESIERISDMMKVFDVIADAFKVVEEISSAMMRVLDLLDVFIPPMKVVDDLMDTQISFIFFSVSIRNLLRGAGNIPGFGEIMSILGSALKAVNLDIDVNIPGLDKLFGTLNTVFEQVLVLDKDFQTLFVDFKHFDGPDSFLNKIGELEMKRLKVSFE